MENVFEFQAREEARKAREQATTESAPWPDPLDEEAAFHGLAGEVVRKIEPESEADPVALLVQFLAGFGNACGRSHYVQIEGDRHPPQVWPVLTGSTCKGRKGTSLGRVRQIFDLAVPDWPKPRSGLSSGEGIIWPIRDPITRRVKDKSTGESVEEETDPGVEDKRLFVVETEFVSVLRNFDRMGNTLSPQLRSLWDRGDVESMTKNSPAKTTGAMVTVVGHITADELRRSLTRTEIANGLANRFLFVCVRRSRTLPFGGNRIDMRPLADDIGQMLQRVYEREETGATAVDWTLEAREIWKKVYVELSEGKPGLLGAVVAGRSTDASSTLIYALLDGVDELHPAHINAALAVWKYCEQSAAYLFGTSLGDPVADDILQALKARGEDGMTRKEIYHLFSGHQTSAAISQALASLATRNLARYESKPTGGRPVEQWYAI